MSTRTDPIAFQTRETLLQDHVSTVYRGVLKGESETKILRIQKEKPKKRTLSIF